jgi:hypothetical protein
VLEIFDKNFHDLDQLVWAGRYDVKPILGDVRFIERYVNTCEYDVIFWDHGPEHVSMDDLISTTTKLKKFAGKCLIYCCPWGLWPQGPEDGNVSEIHQIEIDAEMLKEFGMVVQEFGQAGQRGEGELLGIAVRTKHF